MRRAGLSLLLATTLAGALPAQAATAESLRRARGLYENLEAERALALLRQIVSAAWSDPVQPDQRVEAFVYLGALFVLRGEPDSAAAYFRSALELDAFTDLDPTVFTPAQLAAFAQARRLTFAVALRPIRPARLDPRDAQFTVSLSVAATHAAEVTVEIVPVRAPPDARVTLYRGEIEHARELRWNALVADGHLIPPGRYVLQMTGRSRILDQVDSARVYFDVAHEVQPLEDTLPEFPAGALLPERLPRSVATRDLFLGVGIAAAVTVISDGLASPRLDNGARTGSRVVAGLAVGTGVLSFALHRRRRDIPSNVAANATRRAERSVANDAIRRRNEAKLSATILLFSPAVGIGP